jgi:hypothetical protein
MWMVTQCSIDRLTAATKARRAASGTVLFRIREATLAHDFADVRDLAFPGDTCRLMDIRRSGAVEAIAGGADASLPCSPFSVKRNAGATLLRAAAQFVAWRRFVALYVAGAAPRARPPHVTIRGWPYSPASGVDRRSARSRSSFSTARCLGEDAKDGYALHECMLAVGNRRQGNTAKVRYRRSCR